MVLHTNYSISCLPSQLLLFPFQEYLSHFSAPVRIFSTLQCSTEIPFLSQSFLTSMSWLIWTFKNIALTSHPTKLALTVYCLTFENYVPLIELNKYLSAYYLQSNVPGTKIIKAKPPLTLWESSHCLKFLLYLPNLYAHSNNK